MYFIMIRYLFLEVVFIKKREQNHKVKFSNSKQGTGREAESTENAERQKTSFLKE